MSNVLSHPINIPLNKIISKLVHHQMLYLMRFYTVKIDWC